MGREFVGVSRNGVRVFVDVANSHAATHIRETPGLLELVREVLSATDVVGGELAFDYDLGRIVGDDDVVATTDLDEIVYARRPNRDNYTRFVKNRAHEPTRFVTIILREAEEGYELWTAWVGRLAPSFPGSSTESPESRGFWAEHALAWGKQDIVPGTEITEQPW